MATGDTPLVAMASCWITLVDFVLRFSSCIVTYSIHQYLIQVKWGSLRVPIKRGATHIQLFRKIGFRLFFPEVYFKENTLLHLAEWLPRGILRQNNFNLPL